MNKPLMKRLVESILPPLVVFGIVVGLWQACILGFQVKPYLLPSPLAVIQAYWQDASLLARAVVYTGSAALLGFVISLVVGTLIAFAFSQSRILRASGYPYFIFLQTVPIVAIAPLLLIYLPQHLAVLACAWIVAFFPVLANTTLGLNSIDHNLRDLFRLCGATPLQVLFRLKLPAALPYMLGGLKIAGGLSLIGAVVAEIAAGSAGAGSGLAYRIAESGYRLNIPRMFAALLLLSIAGVAIHFALSLVSHLMLRRWHESAMEREN